MYIEKSIYIMFVNSGMKVWKREEQFMNNVKVQTKLIIVMLATIVALVLCAVISSESMKQLQSKHWKRWKQMSAHLTTNRSNSRWTM